MSLSPPRDSPSADRAERDSSSPNSPLHDRIPYTPSGSPNLFSLPSSLMIDIGEDHLFSPSPSASPTMPGLERASPIGRGGESPPFPHWSPRSEGITNVGCLHVLEMLQAIH